MLPGLGITTGIAIVLSVIISVKTEIHFLLPTIVFIFWGPVASIICEGFLSRNPAYGAMTGNRSWLPYIVAFIVISIVAALVTTKFSKMGLWDWAKEKYKQVEK